MATVATETSTKAEIDAKIDHMAANAADVMWGIEGVNEPNLDSTSGSWVAPAALRQKWIALRIRSHRRWHT